MRLSSLIFVALSAFLAWPPAQTDPVSLPAHDRHEGLVIAAKPCLDPAEAKREFGKASPLDAGILPLEVFLKNETTQPMRLALDSVVLEVESPGEPRQKIDWLSPKEVANLIAHPGGTPDPDSARKRIPRPVPMPSHDKKVDNLTDTLRPLTLDTDVIPPLATIHGYLFFDMSHNFGMVKDAMLYVPEVRVIPGNKSLLFFEVSLAPAVKN